MNINLSDNIPCIVFLPFWDGVSVLIEGIDVAVPRTSNNTGGKTYIVGLREGILRLRNSNDRTYPLTCAKTCLPLETPPACERTHKTITRTQQNLDITITVDIRSLHTGNPVIGTIVPCIGDNRYTTLQEIGQGIVYFFYWFPLIVLIIVTIDNFFLFCIQWHTYHSNRACRLYFIL